MPSTKTPKQKVKKMSATQERTSSRPGRRAVRVPVTVKVPVTAYTEFDMKATLEQFAARRGGVLVKRPKAVSGERFFRLAFKSTVGVESFQKDLQENRWNKVKVVEIGEPVPVADTDSE